MVYKIMGEIIKLVESKGYNVWAIFLQGSQNYSLDTEESDYDFKCFVLPNFENIYRNNTTSLTYKTKYGQVEVKDIRLFNELLKKGNISYIEILYSKYKIIKTHKNILDIRDKIVNERKKIIYNTAIGMALQKQKDMCKVTERTQQEISEIGYEKKQLHHIVRIYFLLKRLVKNDFGTAMDLSYEKESLDYCLNLKTNPINLNEAIEVSQQFIEKIRQLEPFYNINIIDESINEFSNRIKEIVKLNLMVDIHKGSDLSVQQTHSHYKQLSPKLKYFLKENYPEINEKHFVDILEYTQFELYNFWEI